MNRQMSLGIGQAPDSLPTARSFARYALLNRRMLAVAAGTCVLLATGCPPRRSSAESDSAELATYARVMMPKKIEIQRYLTQPISFAGNGDADGLEVILAAIDSFGDPTKVVGTFHFELHKIRPASSDREGDRLAFWPIDINSDETLTKYWDRLARFYRFPLKLESPLPPGKYILSARLISPTGDKLFDEYEFASEAGSAPSASTRW